MTLAPASKDTNDAGDVKLIDTTQNFPLGMESLAPTEVWTGNGMTKLHKVADRLYLAAIEDNGFAVDDTCDSYHYFCTDEEISSSCQIYRPFRDNSFSPMNLSAIFQFVQILNRKLEEFKEHKIVYYASKSDRRKLTDALFLLGSYMIIVARHNPVELWESFEWLQPFTEKYEICSDDAFTEGAFNLDLLDCWQAVARSMDLGWVAAYDMHEYIHYDNPLEGDMHWIIPEKILALRSPTQLEPPKTYIDRSGYRSFAPTFYLEPFADMGIKTVVRLNEEYDDHYDGSEFEQVGIRVVNLEFGEDEPPPVFVVAEFLHTLDRASGAVAVHCRTGLVQTATMIAIYLMRSFDFSAREAIAWLRIIRPGAVVGEHSHFLVSVDSARRHIRGCPSSENAAPTEQAEADGDASAPAAGDACCAPPAAPAAAAPAAAAAEAAPAESSEEDLVTPPPPPPPPATTTARLGGACRGEPVRRPHGPPPARREQRHRGGGGSGSGGDDDEGTIEAPAAEAADTFAEGGQESGGAAAAAAGSDDEDGAPSALPLRPLRRSVSLQSAKDALEACAGAGGAGAGRRRRNSRALGSVRRRPESSYDLDAEAAGGAAPPAGGGAHVMVARSASPAMRGEREEGDGRGRGGDAAAAAGAADADAAAHGASDGKAPPGGSATAPPEGGGGGGGDGDKGGGGGGDGGADGLPLGDLRVSEISVR